MRHHFQHPVIFVLSALLFSGSLHAQENSILPVGLGQQLFMDARTSGFTKDASQLLFEGDVVAIGGGAVIAADKVELDQTNRKLSASGHIVIMTDQQVFTGQSVVYHLDTGDFKLTDAVMTVNNRAEVEEISSRIMGFSKAEMEFEAQRKNRLSDISQRKDNLRAEARRQLREKSNVSDDLVEKYAVYLEQEKLAQEQVNPALAGLSRERRESFKRRRDFWDKSRASVLRPKSKSAAANSYFKITGREIQRTNGNDFLARESLWTPCRCEDDESPAWGFQSERTEAQIGGYADLYHPVLEIKGIPVLYLPYMKVPLKSERQSGFLMPSFGFEKRSGNIYSQPVYFDLAPDADATLTTDIFQNRGTRLGLEYRVQQREYSGWELKLEGMRDRLWMEDRGNRAVMKPLYRDGLDTAYSRVGNPQYDNDAYEASPDLSEREYTRQVLEDPTYWKGQVKGGLTEENRTKLENNVDQHMAMPSNSWRGAYLWRGVTYIAPRLSLVSHGEIASDHRYTEDLYVPDNFQDAFFGGRDAKSLSRAGARLHLDGTDFYAGIGSQYGDNYLSNDRFEGQQLPLRLKMQSRYLSLLPDRSPVPLDGQLSFENWRITDKETTSLNFNPQPSLGEGNWRRLRFNTVSPFVTDKIVQVSQFTEFEGRYIEHADLVAPRSEIRSWRTGLELSLPIDGMAELPDFMQDATTNPEGGESQALTDARARGKDGRRFGHHLMDWRLRFSVRPTVVKTGPYTDPFVQENIDNGTSKLAYFASDRFTGDRVDDDVPEEERMKPHRRITFSTTHNWRFLTRQWRLAKAEAAPPAGGAGEESKASEAPVTATPAAATPAVEPAVPVEDSRQQARRELLYSLEKPAARLDKLDDLYDAVQNKWLIDRYQVQDRFEATPLSFNAEVSYDWLDAEERERQRRANAQIDEQIAAAGQVTPTNEADAARIAREQAALKKKKQVLAEPWKEPTTNLVARYGGWSLNNEVQYNLYAKAATKMSFSVGTATYFKTNVSAGYSIQKAVDLMNETFTRTRERTLGVTTSLIPPITTYISLKRRIKDEVPPSYKDSVYTAYGFQYLSSSDCWGLAFSREKDYQADEREASYLLQLSIIFMSQRQMLPNMSGGIVRDLRGGEETDQG